MQLKRFAVGTIAVIHGENNVGKSNLLEAMQLFFQLLLVQSVHNTFGKNRRNPPITKDGNCLSE
jgi:AAA15 family ATPase/GTPase